MLDTTCSTIVNDTSLAVLFSDSNVNLDGIQYFKSLKTLNCNGVGIETIPVLPSSLISFTCRDNMLKNLPTLPPGLVYLDCLGNQLTSLPSLDDSLKCLNCADNNIYCLPFLPSTIQTIIVDSSKIHCLPNAINYNTSISDYNSLADLHLSICNSINSANNCPVYNYSVYGYAFFDNNNNGVLDNNEPIIPNLKIKLTGNSFIYNTVTSPIGYYPNGYYYFLPTTSGNYTLTADTISQLYREVPLSSVVNLTGTDTAAEVDIAFQSALNNPDSLNISGYGYFTSACTYPNIMNPMFIVCGYTGMIVINYKNDGATTVSNPIITVNYDSNTIKYDSSTNPLVINTGTSLVLNDSSLAPSEQKSFTLFFADTSSTISVGLTLPYTNTASIIAPNGTGDITTFMNWGTALVPLKLTSFNAIKEPDNTSLLTWSTADETNTKSFSIEQSTDGVHFISIASVAAKGETINNYTYNTGKLTAPVTYFRLKMIDNNGKYTYSTVVAVKSTIDIKDDIEIYPNPANNWINIQTTNTSLINTTARIINSQGATVKNILLQQGLQNVDISYLPAGLYFIQTQLVVKKIIISR